VSAAATPASAVRAYLERRRAALNDEIRHYPTPIARCDVQLGALIDERDAVTRVLREPDDAQVLRGFAAGTGWWSDAEAQALRAALADPA
jgi:hypothetical protein